jgi:molybdopterin-binding protein
MAHLRISEAAALLGVSDDTVRRWAEHGRLALSTGAHGRQVVEGRALARLAQELAEDPDAASTGHRSARNSLRGIVTRVTKDGVMAQVDLQAGPFRVVSLMTREAADQMGLDVGTIATATIKATNVVVETGDPR